MYIGYLLSQPSQVAYDRADEHAEHVEISPMVKVVTDHEVVRRAMSRCAWAWLDSGWRHLTFKGSKIRNLAVHWVCFNSLELIQGN